MNLLYKKHTAVKSKVKTRWYTLQRRLWLKKGCFADDDNDNDNVVVENLKEIGQTII
jgi:hypothetical protein